MTRDQCIDCLKDGVTTRRPIAIIPGGSPAPGPRCVTHHRAERRRLAGRAAQRRVEKTYGLTDAQYQAILEEQGGRCAICRVANGTARRLAVDHDHATGEVRGLLCGPDNIMIGRLRPGGLQRALDYLQDPPARKVLDT